MELKNVVAPKSVYGLYISIDAKSEVMIDNIRNVNGDHKADVAVVFRGNLKEYSLTSFLSRLGFYPGA